MTANELWSFRFRTKSGKACICFELGLGLGSPSVRFFSDIAMEALIGCFLSAEFGHAKRRRVGTGAGGENMELRPSPEFIIASEVFFPSLLFVLFSFVSFNNLYGRDSR